MDLDPKGESAVGQHGFDGLLVHWVGTPFRLFLRVLSDKRQASEMADELGPFTTHIRSVLLGELVDHREAALLCGGEGCSHPAALQRFGSKRSNPPCLHGHVRGGQTLQHEDMHASQSQLNGGQESDRPGSHNHNINQFFQALTLSIYQVLIYTQYINWY
jgi:hypothetical protein